MQKNKNVNYTILTTLLFSVFLAQANNVTVFDIEKHNIENSTKEELKLDSLLNNKEKGILKFRDYFSKHKYRGHQLRSVIGHKEEYLELLNDDGFFTDFIDKQQEIEDKKLYLTKKLETQKEVSTLVKDAFNRIWIIVEDYRGKPTDFNINKGVPNKLIKAILNYGKLEISRGDIQDGRFHESCFAIPTAAVNSYFALLPIMDGVENKTITNTLLVDANKVLKKLAMQSWTQPFRGDDTDNNVISVDRFRKHVWWVGGNGLAYRSVLPTAILMKSVKMVDVLAEVAQKAISWVSQNTYDEAFWTEGFTADGAGWGHGKQSLVWGYPVDGTSSALALLSYFKNTPWSTSKLSETNKKALFNFFQGSSWYYHKGHVALGLDRGSMDYKGYDKKNIKYKTIVNTLLKDWRDSFTDEEIAKLESIVENIEAENFTLNRTKASNYKGSRWFFNNDDLIKKTSDYYIFVNMASVRCDGLESALFADRYNFFADDGTTLFQKNGDEYKRAIGSWNLTALPGVTSRQGEERLTPITNWRGYCSKYNFAGAATSGNGNATAGFVFEKMNASNKEGVNDTTGRNDPNKILYGVKAHKSYFMFDDYMLAMGAGVTNLNTDIEGDIWTTIEQTHWNNDVTWCGYKTKGNATASEQVKKLLKPTDYAKNNPVSLMQKNGFSYAVLPEQTTGEVWFSSEKRASKWKKINGGNKNKKDLPATANILQMWINHGKEAKDAKYVYVVYNGKEKAKSVSNKMSILRNDKKIQAVSYKKGEKIGAIFYDAKAVLATKDWTMRVSAPCTILIEKTDAGYTVSANDPMMDKHLKELEISTNLPIKGAKKEGEDNIIVIPMTEGAFLGKPAVLKTEKL